MSRDDIQKLLGGYATGTLTPEEQQALFEAALDDQDLFNQLAREQALRDLLRDPAAKAHLLTALDSKPRPWVRWWRPAAVAMVMAGVAGVAVIVVRNGVPKPVTVAIVRPQAPPIAMQEHDALRDASPVLEARPEAFQRPAEPQAQPASPAKRRELPAASINGAVDKLKQGVGTAPAGGGGAAPGPAATAGGFVGGVPAPAAPPPPPAVPDARADVAQVKTEAAPQKDQVSIDLKVGEMTMAKAAPGAKALFLARQAAGSAGAKSGFVDSTRQQELNQPLVQQSPAPPAERQQSLQQQQQGQQGGQQAGLSRAKQVRTQNAMSAIADTPRLGARYSVAAGLGLRFETNTPAAADNTAVRIETNSSGFLYTWARTEGGAWRPVTTLSAVRMQSYTTPLRPGEKEILILLSRQARPGVAPPTSSDPGTNLVEKDGAITYVVNPLTGAAGQQLQFTIRLP
jgi:hypothetical protein